MDLQRFKIEPERVSLDDFTVTKRGKTYRPHAGESVWLSPYGAALDDTIDQAAIREGAEEGNIELLERGLDGVCNALAKQIVAWDLTDIEGKPYGDPYGNAGVFHSLPTELVMHLAGVIAGAESEGEEPAASGGLPRTSNTATPKIPATNTGPHVPAN